MEKFEPLFKFTADQSSILLQTEDAEICISQNTYTGKGEVRLDLIPRASIYAYGYFTDVPATDALGVAMDPQGISTFSINNKKIDGFRISSGGDASSGEYNLKWCPKSEPIVGVGSDSTRMSELVFHLLNLPVLIGTRSTSEQDESSIYRIEHVDLECGEWRVEIKSLCSTSDASRRFKEEGGYHLTHIGKIQKIDGSLFSGEDAQKYLTALHYFLSFARGQWCAPSCVVGFDENSKRVWESWSSPKESWKNSLSWFDPHKSSQLAILFPAFIEKWNDEKWGEAFKEVIYWYLNANNSGRGIDAGIILTQAAIERLSYEYAVINKRLVTGKGFKDLWASDNFRLLFASLNIPLEIPNETPVLQQLANKFNWLDAPHALTEVRNSLVHPDHKRRGELGSAYYEVWNLSLWYLEMGLLAVCGYSGTYGNRLKKRWAGQVEEVPWRRME